MPSIKAYTKAKIDSLIESLNKTINTKADVGHKHTTTDVTDFPPTSYTPSAGALVKYSVDGRVQVGTPVQSYDAVQKQQFEAELAKKADSSHKHKPADMDTTNTPTDTTYLRGDGQWATPTNTTYSQVSQAEAEAGTSGTSRVWSALRVKQAILANTPPQTSLNPVPLEDGTNLNDCITTNVWHQPSNSKADLALNYPAVSAGLLEVYQSGAMVYQFFTTYSSIGGSVRGIYWRGKYNTSWSSWVRLSEEGHKHDVSDINTTGTANANTYLRGDGSWASPLSGGGTGGTPTIITSALPPSTNQDTIYYVTG